MVLKLLLQVLARLIGVDSAIASLAHLEDQRSKLQQAKLDLVIAVQAKQSEAIGRILDSVTSGPAVAILFDATIPGEPTEEGVTMKQITDIQKLTIVIKVLDAKKNPAPIDGVPVWTSSDESKITLAPSSDGLTCVASAVGPLTEPDTSVQVKVVVDADLGPGQELIPGTFDITVVGSKAVAVEMNAGEPENQ